MFAKQVLCEEGKHIPQFNDNLRSETGQDCMFLKRNKDASRLRKCQNLTPSKAALSAEDVTTLLSILQQSLAEGDGNEIPPQNLFNYDETNLSDDCGTKLCVFKKSTKHLQRI